MDWRRVLRIARWEVGRSQGQLDRKTAAALAVILLGLAPVSLLLMSGGAAMDQGIYRVGVAEDSDYRPALEQAPSFRVSPQSVEALRNGDIDLLVQGDRFLAQETDKGKAAMSAFGEAVYSYNNRQMAEEENVSAAFPVSVDLVYLEREVLEIVSPGGRVGGAGGGQGGGDSGATPSPGGGEEDGGAGTPSPGEGAGGLQEGPAGGGAAGLGTALGQDQFDLNSPSQIQPPFPFRSLILAFLFVIPMNFVVQVYGSSMMEERINRRGEMMLVSPASRYEIIVGKTLPYLAAIMALAAGTALVIGGGWISLAAALPIALIFTSSTFMGALLARSFKELTFVMVSLSVFITTYIFIPAVFTGIHPIAAISPVTMVVQDLQNEAVPLGDYVFSTTPLYLASAALFLMGSSIYREEDLFTQKPVHRKALDSMAGQIARLRDVAKLTLLFIPFVFVVELLGIAALFALPVSTSLPALVLIVALTEEFFKSIHVYAAFRSGSLTPSRRTAVAAGLASGIGFYVGEKLTLLTSLVGLDVQIQLGRAAFGLPDLPLPLLLVLPLALHVVTASISSLGAAKDRRLYVIALTGAVALHYFYNMQVVNLIG